MVKPTRSSSLLQQPPLFSTTSPPQKCTPLTAGVTVKVVTIEGEVVGRGQEGEIRVTGPQLCLGYTDPELDAHGFDEEGYFRTGDLGTRDVDDQVLERDETNQLLSANKYVDLVKEAVKNERYRRNEGSK